MNWITSLPASDFTPSAKGEAHLPDYRQRREMAEREREERKRLEQADQCSELSSPGVRIRAWEKVHHLRMPADTSHPVLRQIAAATHLALADVLAEQQSRAERRASQDV